MTLTLKKYPYISRSLCESCKQVKKCFKKDYLVNNSRAVNILLFCETALVQKRQKIRRSNNLHKNLCTMYVQIGT